MAARRAMPPGAGLIGRLPAVRGRYAENVALAPITWFRVGGPAEVVFRPADEADLAGFLAEKPADVPVTVLGVGSNLLVRDGGVPGVVIRLGRGFARIAAEAGDAAAPGRIVAGAGALDLNVALTARDAGIGGLEFLSGIPGTVGGALRMNAGAYGRETKDVLVSARLVEGDGSARVLAAADIGFAYRHSGVAADSIFVEATFAGERAEVAAIGARMAAIREAREGSQPIRARTGGSTFANPEMADAGAAKAWQLIDRAGCRGLRRGGAEVSEQHCNFLINTGNATAADLEGLGEEVRRRVRETTGVELRWEIERIGVPGPAAAEEGRV
ncbi:MAG: UDP-N-acetylmuramate dehydrogenase [Rhodospirillales bacterium]